MERDLDGLLRNDIDRGTSSSSEARGDTVAKASPEPELRGRGDPLFGSDSPSEPEQLPPLVPNDDSSPAEDRRLRVDGTNGI